MSLNISQSDKEKILYQNNYTDSMKYISLNREIKKNNDKTLTKNGFEELQALVRQLGWVAG